MSDPFEFAKTPALTYPTEMAYAVSASDSVDLPTAPRALYVGGTGDLAFVPLAAPDDTPVVLKNVAAGMVYPIRARRIMATATTASYIVALL